ncbi:MAG: C40 family peptidase [Myxococcaceae bacterium]|nr:C40 family peptidase [Myxococcaceae bacterium]
MNTVWLLAALVSPVEASAPALEAKSVEAVIRSGMRFEGTPYRFGADVESSDAVDCSSLVLKAFKSVGLVLPRIAWRQALVGQLIGADQLRRGDRLYFKLTDRPVPIDHTALYLGDGLMLHAWPATGVAVVPFADFRDWFRYARR